MGCGRYHDHFQIFISQECAEVRGRYANVLQEVSKLYEESMKKFENFEDFINICSEIRNRAVKEGEQSY